MGVCRRWKSRAETGSGISTVITCSLHLTLMHQYIKPQESANLHAHSYGKSYSVHKMKTVRDAHAIASVSVSHLPLLAAGTLERIFQKKSAYAWFWRKPPFSGMSSYIHLETLIYIYRYILTIKNFRNFLTLL